MVGIDDRGVVLARQCGEFRHDEAVMPHLERVAQPNPVLLFRQKLQEGLEIVGVEFLSRRELPQDRSELLAERRNAGAKEAHHRFPRFAEHPPVGDEAVAFQRKDEAVRRVGGPFHEGRFLEAGIVGAVDLDARHLAACVVQLLGLGELLRIEGRIPRLEGPAAHAGADFSLAHRLPPSFKMRSGRLVDRFGHVDHGPSWSVVIGAATRFPIAIGRIERDVPLHA